MSLEQAYEQKCKQCDRLAAENEELREALEFFTTSYRALVNGKTSYKMPEALKMADAALAKVKESGK